MNIKQLVFGNISNKGIKLIIILFGVILVVLAYLLGFTKINEKTESVKIKNASLQKEEKVLKEMDANKENNEIMISVYNAQAEKNLNKYPVLLHGEDTVAYAMNMEKKADSSLKISDISIEEQLLLYSTDDKGAINGASAEQSLTDAAANGESVSTSVDTADATLTTQEKNDISSYSISQDFSYGLYKTPVKYDFTIGYDDFKNILKLIRGNTDKQSVDSVALKYDKETGNLEGSMVVNQYTVTGTDKTYTEPSVGNSNIGNKSPFNTIE